VVTRRWKILEDMFIRFDRIQEREIPRQMDRHRMHDVAGRACIASRGKPEAKKLRQIYESDVKKLYQWKGRPDPHNPSYGFAMQWHSNLCFTRSSAAAKRPRDAPCHWKSCCHPKSLKAILLVFHCNDVSISYRFWDIQLWILARPWNLG